MPLFKYAQTTLMVVLFVDQIAQIYPYNSEFLSGSSGNEKGFRSYSWTTENPSSNKDSAGESEKPNKPVQSMQIPRNPHIKEIYKSQVTSEGVKASNRAGKKLQKKFEAVVVKRGKRSARSNPKQNLQNGIRNAPDQTKPDQCETEIPSVCLCDFNTYEDIITKLNEYAQKFDFTSIGTIGKSVNGLPLSYIKIELGGNMTDTGSPKPQVKMIGSMHGNEVSGSQQLTFLLDYLMYNFEQNDERVVSMLKNTVLYIMPVLNPDGYKISQQNCEGVFGRTNENDIDLNRDFPDQFNDARNGKHIFDDKLYEGRQPETQAIMDWVKFQKFHLSANIHNGEMVVSYPFDSSRARQSGFYAKSPDDEFFKYGAHIYADSHLTMHNNNMGCRNQSNFDRGTTNGAEWYDVTGGMQDFNYAWGDCFEFTLELNCCKHYKPEHLIEEWLDNKEALLKFIELGNSGIAGSVTDENGRKVTALIQVKGIDKLIRTDDQGNFVRLLRPGNYEVSAISETGAQSKVELVEVNNKWPPKLMDINFTLAPIQQETNNTPKDKTSALRSGQSQDRTYEDLTL